MTFDQAKAHLKRAVEEDGALEDYMPTLIFKPGSLYVFLEGDFSADDLEAIAAYMRGAERP